MDARLRLDVVYIPHHKVEDLQLHFLCQLRVFPQQEAEFSPTCRSRVWEPIGTPACLRWTFSPDLNGGCSADNAAVSSVLSPHSMTHKPPTLLCSLKPLGIGWPTFQVAINLKMFFTAWITLHRRLFQPLGSWPHFNTEMP